MYMCRGETDINSVGNRSIKASVIQTIRTAFFKKKKKAQKTKEHPVEVQLIYLLGS